MTSHTETRERVNVVGTLRNSGTQDARAFREGIAAGTVAASGVALWYLIRDLMAGYPLFTPRLLGQWVGRLFGIDGMSGGTTAAILGFTGLHFLGFIVLGVVAAAVVRMARRNATVLAGAFLLFVLVETAFYVAIGLLNQGTLDGMLEWSQLAAGNIIGCGLLALVIRRAHPELPNEFRLAMNGTGTWSVQ